MTTTSSAALRSVLIVDDDDRLRRVVRDYAEAVGVMAWEATNGLDALWIVQHHRPAVVLLDLTMPRLGGFETARHIQKFDPSIRIIVVTGDRREETQRHVAALGFGVILKPFELDALDGALVGSELSSFIPRAGLRDRTGTGARPGRRTRRSSPLPP